LEFAERVTLGAWYGHVGVLDEGLPPDFNQCLLEGNGRWTPQFKGCNLLLGMRPIFLSLIHYSP
jgi:hypothetical protein